MLSTCDLLPGPSHENEENENSIWLSTSGTTLSHNNGWHNTSTAATLEYILMAPTSAAIPLHEQPVTFLNQNQSYEIKCRKCALEPCSGQQESCYKTVITICFDNKKLRYQINDLMEIWKTKNPGKRFFTLDMPRCSNVSHVKYALRSAEFVWDGSLPNAALFIKFFVLSSDFVDNCGEKGEPFRLVFQTYCWRTSELLQQNSSLIQIFKLRGAERKRRTERKKATMHANQEQYQPSYDYTFLLGADFDYDVDNEERVTPIEEIGSIGVTLGRSKLLRVPTVPDDMEQMVSKKRCTMLLDSSYSRENSMNETDIGDVRICANHSASFISKWLSSHRFNNCVHIFDNYNGEDILRLSISDLTALTGDKPEALRLFHALRKKALEPQITIYIALEGSSIYNMMKLYNGTLDELKDQMERMIGVTLRQILVRGPRDILVRVTDQVIESWKNESIFRVVRTDNDCTLVAEM
uniref:Grh/CP2 DB domain-containing protein n=1 Tax=Setaria digitata TaxID=48799 RepID=A0A915PLQ0_9BILA